ncbi:MAG: hypothetical protein HOV79_10050 [Hamadaea sp.]|nr:hypothetical protein [Hamadaea sp.]
MTPEQMANFETGPPFRAMEWVASIRNRDFPRTWDLTSTEFRLWLAQNWCYRNRNHPLVRAAGPQKLAEDLANDPAAEGELSDAFQDGVMRLLAENIASLAEDCTPSINPRTLGIDLELAILLDPDTAPRDEHGQPYWPADTVIEGFELIVKHQDDWRVHAIGKALPEPGWPPSWTMIETGTEPPEHR